MAILPARPTQLLVLALAAAGLAACGKSSESAPPVVAPTPLAAIHTPPPEYPVELACAGIGGVVTLTVTVGTEGKPTEVKLTRSSGQPALDESARKAVGADWQFEAATRNGQPLVQTIQVPVTFSPPQERPSECFALDAQQKPGR